MKEGLYARCFIFLLTEFGRAYSFYTKFFTTVARAGDLLLYHKI